MSAGSVARALALAVAALVLPLVAPPARAIDDMLFQGKFDAIYVPTPQEVVDGMLAVAGVGPDDFVVDLGSGDGRIPIAAAAQRGARGLGVELEVRLIEHSRAKALEAGVADRVEFREQDLFTTDLGEATVVTLYLLPELNLRLRPRLLDHARPGTRVVSHQFDMGDWTPDRHVMLGRNNLYLWIVPARAAGRWRVEAPGGAFTLVLEQTFQTVEGRATAGGRDLPLIDATLRGADIAFAIERDGRRERYVGRVEGDRIVAAAGDGAVAGWRAARD